MTKQIVLAILLGCMTCSASAAPLDEGFAEVPTQARPWAYWWWLNGNVDKETITRDMEAMKRVGFGGILMFGIPGVLIGPVIASLFITVWELYGIAFSDYLPEVHYTKQPAERIESSGGEDRDNSSDRDSGPDAS